MDKFHVIQLVNRSLEAVRKSVRAQLTPAQRKTLMHGRFILLRRKADLDESQVLILESWINNLPMLGTAYELKEAFCVLWDAETSEQARARFQAWQERIPAEVLPAFQPLLTVITNWNQEIFAHERRA